MTDRPPGSTRHWTAPKTSQQAAVEVQRPIPVIIATTREDLVFQAERAAARYLALNATSARSRLVVIVRELDPGELERG